MDDSDLVGASKVREKSERLLGGSSASGQNALTRSLAKVSTKLGGGRECSPMHRKRLGTSSGAAAQLFS